MNDFEKSIVRMFSFVQVVGFAMHDLYKMICAPKNA
jgi:hypothetical protein